MSANREAKALGLKNLIEVSEITKRNNRNTLHNWYNTSPELFRAVLLGCVKFKELKSQGLNDEIFVEGTAAKQAKFAGLKDIEELCTLIKKHRNTIYSWHQRYPAFFKIIVLGSIEMKKASN